MHGTRVVQVDVLHSLDEDGEQAVPNGHGAELHQLFDGLHHHPIQLLDLLYRFMYSSAYTVYMYDIDRELYPGQDSRSSTL